MENKQPLELEDDKLEEIFRYFLDYLNGMLTRPEEVSDAFKLPAAEQNLQLLDKTHKAIKNSVFSDLLFEKYGLEFSKLSFIIEGKIV